MSQVYWKGGTTAVAQVDTLTVGGTVETDDIFSITIYGEDGSSATLNVAAGSTTPATVATNIATAFNASTNPLFTPITAAANSATVTLTADNAGIPFYASVNTTEANGSAADSQTFIRSETTKNSGPNDFNTLGNWSTANSAVAQVDTLTVGGTVEADDIFVITLTQGSISKSLSVTAGSTTISTVVGNIVTAFNASTDGFFARITAVGASPNITLTADSAGTPFYCSVTTTEAGGGAADSQTFARAATTLNVGIPSTADDLVLDGRGAANSLIYGLVQSSVTLTSFKHFQSMTAPVGTNLAALQISATTSETNLPVTDGRSVTPGFLNINFGSVATAFENFGGGNGSGGLPGVTIAGSNASNKFTSHAGNVGIGLLTPNQTCTFPTIDVRGGSLTTGSGTAFTTATNNGGTVILYNGSASGTLNNLAGTTTVEGTAKIGTITCAGGVVKHNVRISGDDIDTLNLDGGDIDFTGNTSAFTVNALAIKRGGNIRVFNNTQATFTATTIDDNYGVQFRVQIG